jgi:hypothetical protein
MTLADKLNLCGILLTGAGSTVAMVGVFFQMNGYFAIKWRHIPAQLWTVFAKMRSGSFAGALSQLNIDARLGETKKEDRGKSLFGFYCVLFGFLLQMLGSALLFWALFGNSRSGTCKAI